jgi:NADH dehydrogenase
MLRGGKGKRDTAPGRRPHVVVVGAGFGGLAAAKRLRRAPVDVTVIDRRNHHLFQPLLYQVATAALSPADIAAPIRAVLHAGRRRDAYVLLDEVIGVDAQARYLRTRDGAAQVYDYLILATGSEFSYFGHEAEWARFAPGLKTIEDATEIRRRVLLAFEKAETSHDRAEQERLLTFVLIGGGPTGVEMAGALAELAKATLARDFSRIDPRAARILLVEAAPRLLGGFAERLGDYARRALAGMGVEVLTDTRIEAIDADGVVANGRRIPARTVIWCAGVKATPVGAWLGVPTTRNGAVEVLPDLSVAEAPEIFVIGDAASVAGPEGRPLPGLAPVAKQQGEYVADLIARRVRGAPAPGPFAYRDWGSMATIGRSAAVAEIGGARFTGVAAWLLWGLVHITYLIGFRNRVVVTVNWIWAWMTYAKGARLITGVRGEASAALPADRLVAERIENRSAV